MSDSFNQLIGNAILPVAFLASLYWLASCVVSGPRYPETKRADYGEQRNASSPNEETFRASCVVHHHSYCKDSAPGYCGNSKCRAIHYRSPPESATAPQAEPTDGEL